MPYSHVEGGLTDVPPHLAERLSRDQLTDVAKATLREIVLMPITGVGLAIFGSIFVDTAERELLRGDLGLGLFMGEVMKGTQGKADPRQANDVVKRLLDQDA